MKRLTIKNRVGENEPELLIYGPIGDAWLGYIDDVSVMAALRELRDEPRLTIRINSPGGDAIMGFAIYNAIVRHSAHVTMTVDALAASAGSVIAMAGDEIQIAANAFVMIHRASTIVWGNQDDMMKTAELLKKVDGSLLDMYTARTGGKSKRDEIEEWLAAETWMNAEESVARGFADSIGQELQVPAESLPEARYKNAPKSLFKGGKPKAEAEEKPTEDPPEDPRTPGLNAAKNRLRIRRRA